MPSTRCAASILDSRARQADGRDGPVGLGQVDADAHPRRARQADLRRPSTIDGIDITNLDDTDLTKLRRKHIGFVFQFFNLLADADRGGERPAAALDRRREAGQRLVRRAAAATSASTDRRTHRPAELSGGQQQRVAIARALVSQPTVVFADEPTGNLDSTTSGEILDLLRSSVDDYGQTTVMVTHDARAASIADRILFLADGLIVRELGRTSQDAVLRVMDELGTDSAVTKFALKGLLGRKLRAALTAIAIVLGVAMVSGTYVLTDSINGAFDAIFTQSTRTPTSSSPASPRSTEPERERRAGAELSTSRCC